MTSDSIKNFGAVIFIFLFVFGCREYERLETREVRRGEISCVHKIGVKKGYSEEEFYNLGTKIYVGGAEFKPENYTDFNDGVADCEVSPDESVLTLKIYNVNYEKGGIYLLRIENGKSVLTQIAPARGDAEGAWTNDGRWLLFKSYLINVETGERREIKTLPEKPSFYTMVGTSPDLKTIVMYGDREGDLLGLKLIDAETGETKTPRFEIAKYDWLLDKTHVIQNTGANHIWISNHFKWEKDARDGKDKLIYPVAATATKKKDE